MVGIPPLDNPFDQLSIRGVRGAFVLSLLFFIFVFVGDYDSRDEFAE